MQGTTRIRKSKSLPDIPWLCEPELMAFCSCWREMTIPSWPSTKFLTVLKRFTKICQPSLDLVLKKFVSRVSTWRCPCASRPCRCFFCFTATRSYPSNELDARIDPSLHQAFVSMSPHQKLLGVSSGSPDSRIGSYKMLGRFIMRLHSCKKLHLLVTYHLISAIFIYKIQPCCGLTAHKRNNGLVCLILKHSNLNLSHVIIAGERLMSRSAEVNCI